MITGTMIAFLRLRLLRPMTNITAARDRQHDQDTVDPQGNIDIGESSAINNSGAGGVQQSELFEEIMQADHQEKQYAQHAELIASDTDQAGEGVFIETAAAASAHTEHTALAAAKGTLPPWPPKNWPKGLLFCS